MNIPNGIILIWTGLVANIPANYTRETTLDGKFPKSCSDSVAPNTTGGNATHTHSSPAHSHSIPNHTHTYTTGAAGSSGGHHGTSGSQDLFSYGTHTHSGTTGNADLNSTDSVAVTYGFASNNPPYYEVICIKSNGLSGLPNNVIALFADSNLPASWQVCDGQNSTPDLRNKYLRSSATSQEAGATGGSLTHSHDISHSHTIPAHNHGQSTTGSPNQGFCDVRGNSDNCPSCGHTHTITFNQANSYNESFSVSLNCPETVEPAYRKLLAIINKTGTFSKPKGIIGLWLGTIANIPRGWKLCDGQNGTPDMRDKFLKIANDTSELDTTGGLHTHPHATQNHTHSSSQNHAHTSASISAHQAQSQEGGGLGSENPRVGQHEHASFTTDLASITYNSANTSANSSNNEPEYRTIAYIQYQKAAYGGAVLTALL